MAAVACIAMGIAVRAPAQQMPDASGQVRVGLSGHYQFFSSDTYTLSQLSTPLFVHAVVADGVELTIRAAQSRSSGDLFESVSGIGDVQVGALYTPAMTGSAVTLGLNLNLPAGRDELTPEEFQTSLYMNRQFYGFRMPGLGQGFNVSPSVGWAHSLTPDVAVGLGASYQYRGTFRPVSGMDRAFNPGNEVLLTLGFDVRTRPAAAVSADVTVTFFADDRIGDEVVFQAGRNLTAVARYKQFIDFDFLQVSGIYRSRARPDEPSVGAGPLEGRTVPNSGEFTALYGWRINRQVTFGFFGLARFFQSTELFPDERQFFALGVSPDFEAAPNFRIVARASYGLGSASGGEVGVGIVAGF